MKPGSVLSVYWNSWWLAPAIALLALLVFAASELVPPLMAGPHTWLALFFTICVSTLGLFVVAIGNLARKRWAMGFLHLLFGMIPAAAIGRLVLLAAMFCAMLGPSEDHFADNLIIPEGMEVVETNVGSDRGFIVTPSSAAAADSGPDHFQHALLDAFKQPGGNDANVTVSVDALARLHTAAPDLLRRYLAANPAWRVFAERGKRFATRRWKVGGEWQYTLHGYYTEFDQHLGVGSAVRFQHRLTLGFTGEPWAGRRRGGTQIPPGDTRPLNLSDDNRMHESRLIVDLPQNLVVEIFEQSESMERVLTRATLDLLEAELAPLVTTPTWEAAREMLPAGSVRVGVPSIEVRQSFQPGIYDVEIWVNPAEPGMIYLRAFELTRGTALSTSRLAQASNEWVGWSDAPGELFFSNSHVTIYEGDWGKPYAARFEVWFVPDRGGPERKLLDTVFKIEGWQR